MCFFYHNKITLSRLSYLIFKMLRQVVPRPPVTSSPPPRPPPSSSSSSSDDQLPPPPKKTKNDENLQGSLPEKSKEEVCKSKLAKNDVIFLVGNYQQRARVPARRGPLISQSAVFEAMFSDRWDEYKEFLIHLPLGIELDGFHAFLEGVYTEKLDKGLSLEVVIQVLKLGDMYCVTKMTEAAEFIISSNFWYSNCVDIMEGTRLVGSSNVSRYAFDYLKRNFIAVVNVNGHLGMSHDLWMEILTCDGLDAGELKLFQALIEWRDFKANREIKELLKYVRFTLMESSEFSKYVIPANVLAQQDVIHILTYFTNIGTLLPDAPMYDIRPRSGVKVAKNTFELFCLLQKEEKDEDLFIQLVEGVYEIKQGFWIPNRVRIRGVGEKSVLRAVGGLKRSLRRTHVPYRFSIVGDDSSISHLKLESSTSSSGLFSGQTHFLILQVHASYCELYNLTLVGCSVIIYGDRNRVQNVSFSSPCSLPCIQLMNSSLKCVVEKISIQNTATGIVMQGSSQTVVGLTCENVNSGVEVHGKRQLVKNLHFVKSSIEELDVKHDPLHDTAYFAVKMYNGKENTVTDVSCEGLLGSRRTYALVMRSTEQEDADGEDNQVMNNHFIRNVGPGRVVVLGKDHCLTGVDAGPELKVYGICHKFLECRAKAGTYFGRGNGDLGTREDYFKSIKIEDCDFSLAMMPRLESERWWLD